MKTFLVNIRHPDSVDTTSFVVRAESEGDARTKAAAAMPEPLQKTCHDPEFTQVLETAQTGDPLLSAFGRAFNGGS